MKDVWPKDIRFIAYIITLVNVPVVVYTEGLSFKTALLILAGYAMGYCTRDWLHYYYQKRAK